MIQEVEREAAGAAAETLLGIKMIAACGAEDKFIKRYHEIVQRITLMSKGLSPILAVQHAPVYNAIHAASIFFTIVDAPKPCSAGSKEENIIAGADLTLTNVNFAYPSRHDVKVLKGLTLTIPAGRTTAIVGPSGSGKSTVIALLQRWYELDEVEPIASYLRSGSIKIGNTNLNEIDLHWWRSRIGLVQQETCLFNDTIYKNVEHGLVGTPWEFAQEHLKRNMIEKACREAYADEFIQNLPSFSGGQRQRIAIARAIVRQPKILVFDEATSALDVNSERIVQAALESAARFRTTIIIAHRLSTIRNSHQIVVIADGKVVQSGDHRSLVSEEGGVYKKLVIAQRIGDSSAEKMPTENPFLKGSSLKEKESCETIVESETTAVEGMGDVVKIKTTSIFGSFMMLLTENKDNWIGYLILRAHSVGMLTTRLATDPVQLQQLIGANMAMVLISMFGLVGCTIIAVLCHWKYGLVVIISSLPIIVAGGW
ncbi:hypothetical protein IAQ61_006474 [Plenodomus lingam]|uniref:uncharacterized protein n=1 Tax=Leptosphaeria maculans TaxID=5022 RepID=UPI00332CE8F1|nr:hypothetical protein IAQ61_006474 [Plenodomus lingam]